MYINLIHPETKEIVQTKYGFSWTTFFFGGFPAAFRYDWKYAFIIFIAGALTRNFSTLIFAFVYNRIFINDKLSEGFIAEDPQTYDLLVEKQFIKEV